VVKELILETHAFGKGASKGLKGKKSEDDLPVE